MTDQNDIASIAADLSTRVAKVSKYVAEAKALRSAAEQSSICGCWNLPAAVDGCFAGITNMHELIRDAVTVGFNQHAAALEAKAHEIIRSLAGTTQPVIAASAPSEGIVVNMPDYTPRRIGVGAAVDHDDEDASGAVTIKHKPVLQDADGNTPIRTSAFRGSPR